MTIRLAKADKASSIDLIERVLDRFCLSGLHSLQQANLREHLAWMRAQASDMNVNFKLETVPELHMTRITLEIAFAPIPPVRKQ